MTMFLPRTTRTVLVSNYRDYVSTSNYVDHGDYIFASDYGDYIWFQTTETTGTKFFRGTTYCSTNK